MFEENVIDGVLSFKLVENGQFIEYTPKRLTYIHRIYQIQSVAMNLDYGEDYSTA